MREANGRESNHREALENFAPRYRMRPDQGFHFRALRKQILFYIFISFMGWKMFMFVVVVYIFCYFLNVSFIFQVLKSFLLKWHDFHSRSIIPEVWDVDDIFIRYWKLMRHVFEHHEAPQIPQQTFVILGDVQSSLKSLWSFKSLRKHLHTPKVWKERDEEFKSSSHILRSLLQDKSFQFLVLFSLLWVCKRIPCLTSSNLFNNTICDRFSNFHRKLSCFCDLLNQFSCESNLSSLIPTCLWDLWKTFSFPIIPFCVGNFHCLFEFYSENSIIILMAWTKR